MISPRDTMSGLAKGLAVIETFGPETPRQTIAEVARKSGLDRATVRRCLLTLTSLEFAAWDGKFFTLTPRVLRLGTACLAAMPLPQLAQPLLDQLSDQTGESSSVAVLDGPEIVYVARAAQRKIMSIGLMPGSRLPAYCTAMGRVLLAALPEAKARAILMSAPLTARTPYTQTDPEAIMEALPQIRAAGFALVEQEVELGVRSLAVPVHDVHGRVVAAVNTGVAANLAPPEDLVTQLLPLLRELDTSLRRILR